MAEFQRLSMHTDEARRLAAAAGRVRVDGVDQYVSRLLDDREAVWADLIPRLRREHAVFPEVAECLGALAAAPVVPGTDAAARLRANLALLALGMDAGLGPVVEAIEGSDERLRSTALAGIPDYQPHLRWPDRYYAAVCASCERILDSTGGEDRVRALRILFHLPIPALADAMRGHLAGACDLRRRRAALWLLCQRYDGEARTCISRAIAKALPRDRQARAGWYRAVEDLMRETAHCYQQTQSPATRTWAAATVLILLDRLVGAARITGEPDIRIRWFLVSGVLATIKDDIPVSAHPLLARWAQAHRPGKWQRASAFAQYASHAGAAAVPILLGELERGDIGNQAILVRKLRTLAPASDYPTLAPVLRARLDAIAPQPPAGSGEQDALAAIAAALALFDRRAATRVAARLGELGPAQRREVGWALQGLTMGGIADLLAHAGAIAPFAPDAQASFDGDGHLVRQMLHRQQRLVIFNTRDDSRDTTAVRVVTALASACVPPVTLEAVSAEHGGVRFVHGQRVYAVQGVYSDEQCHEAAAAFDAFLAGIGHPQRVFAIGEDHGDVDNDIGAFFCANPARLPGVARRLGFPVTPAAGAVRR